MEETNLPAVLTASENLGDLTIQNILSGKANVEISPKRSSYKLRGSMVPLILHNVIFSKKLESIHIFVLKKITLLMSKCSNEITFHINQTTVCR